MMPSKNITIDIKPREIISAYKQAPFDIGKEALESQGYHIISLEENANLRIQESQDSYVSRNGNYTKEGVLYLPSKGRFLTRNSPIMANPREATQAHRERKEYYLTNEQVEQSLQGSIPIKQGSIPTNRFKDEEITVYAFGKSAEEYGSFLGEGEDGIQEMPISLANLEKKPFARQMWFWDLDNRSELDGYFGFLSGGGWVRGIQNSAKGAQKNIEDFLLLNVLTEEEINDPRLLRDALRFYKNNIGFLK